MYEFSYCHEYLEFAAQQHSRTMRRIGIIFLAIGLGWFVFVAMNKGVMIALRDKITLFIQIFLVILGWNACIKGFNPSGARNMKEKIISKSLKSIPSSRLLGWRSLEITDEFFQLSGEHADDIIRPGAVDFINENKAYIFICLANGGVIPLPKRGHSDSAFAELRAQIEFWSGKRINAIPA